MRNLNPVSFTQLLGSARNNGGLPGMLPLILPTLDENGYGRGAQIVRDYIQFERPFDPLPVLLGLCQNCGDELKVAEKANLETGGYVP